MMLYPYFVTTCHFNPRPPRGGRHTLTQANYTGYDFNPRPPRGGRLCCKVIYGAQKLISIHAPREGGDPVTMRALPVITQFQSTPPARGATTEFRQWSTDR